jgi:hypothetical protein
MSLNTNVNEIMGRVKGRGEEERDIRLEDHLEHRLGREHVEIARLNRRSLFKHRTALDVLGREEVGSALVAVLLGDVAGDGARLIEDEAIVILTKSELVQVQVLRGTEWRRAR